MHNKHIIDHTNNNDQVLKDTLLKGKNMEKCKNCDNKVYNNHRHCKDCLDKRTKQTSGKWVVRQEGTNHIYWRVYNSNGQVIINTAFDKVIAEQIVRDHNSAPGLLEALENGVEFFDSESVQGEGEYRTGLYCGLEDRSIEDRYEALDYGYERALGRVSDEIIEGLKEAIAKAVE